MSDTFKLGDIIRWKYNGLEEKFQYGLVIAPESLIRHGSYTFASLGPDLDAVPLELSKLPIRSITVFSFSAQKIITIYQNPEDVPLLIEKVDFPEKTS